VRGFAALVGAATLVLGLTAPASAATPPPRPTSLTAHGSGARHWLGWSDQRTNVGYIVQQARNTSFTQGVTNYRVRGPGRTFTPYLVSAGTTYYFRVRAVSGGLYSGWSNRASFLGGGGLSTIRVASYNSMSASLDGKRHPGGTSAAFSQRRPVQLDLLRQAAADVIGYQEAGSCLRLIQGEPCVLCEATERRNRMLYRARLEAWGRNQAAWHLARAVRGVAIGNAFAASHHLARLLAE